MHMCGDVHLCCGVSALRVCDASGTVSAWGVFEVCNILWVIHTRIHTCRSLTNVYWFNATSLSLSGRSPWLLIIQTVLFRTTIHITLDFTFGISIQTTMMVLWSQYCYCKIMYTIVQVCVVYVCYVFMNICAAKHTCVPVVCVIFKISWALSKCWHRLHIWVYFYYFLEWEI